MQSYTVRPALSSTKVLPGASARRSDGSENKKADVVSTLSVSEITDRYSPLIEVRHSDKPRAGKWSSKKRSGGVHMTPMSATNEKIENFLGTLSHHQTDTLYTYAATSENGTIIDSDYGFDSHILTYPETGSLSYWRSRYPGAPYLRVSREFSSAKIEAAKSAAYAELFKAYDLGEELVEFRDSVKQIGSLITRGVKLVKTGREIYERVLRKEGHKVALDSWMEYRYGIMPIVYSIQDVIKLSEERGKFRTIRKKVYPEDIRSADRPMDVTHFYENGVDSSTMSITAKAGWRSQSSKMSDLVNVNPLTTAAQVYPYAFVVRWFFNVNDWLESHVKSLTSTATSYNACVALKENLQVDVRMYKAPHDHKGSAGPRTFEGVQYVPLLEWHEDYPSSDVLLQRRTIDNYRRTLFKPSDTKLVFNPYLDWKRGVDSLALSLRPISKALGGLK